MGEKRVALRNEKGEPNGRYVYLPSYALWDVGDTEHAESQFGFASDALRALIAAHGERTEENPHGALQLLTAGDGSPYGLHIAAAPPTRSPIRKNDDRSWPMQGLRAERLHLFRRLYDVYGFPVMLAFGMGRDPKGYSWAWLYDVDGFEGEPTRMGDHRYGFRIKPPHWTSGLCQPESIPAPRERAQGSLLDG